MLLRQRLEVQLNAERGVDHERNDTYAFARRAPKVALIEICGCIGESDRLIEYRLEIGYLFVESFYLQELTNALCVLLDIARRNDFADYDSVE